MHNKQSDFEKAISEIFYTAELKAKNSVERFQKNEITWDQLANILRNLEKRARRKADKLSK